MRRNSGEYAGQIWPDAVRQVSVRPVPQGSDDVLVGLTDFRAGLVFGKRLKKHPELPIRQAATRTDPAATSTSIATAMPVRFH
jgi:hypothetical protein